MTLLSVLEFNTENWETEDKKSLLRAWPPELPQVEEVVDWGVRAFASYVGVL